MHGELHLDLVLCTVLYACTHLDEQVSWLFCVHVAATDLSPEIFDSKSLIAIFGSGGNRHSQHKRTFFLLQL